NARPQVSSGSKGDLRSAVSAGSGDPRRALRPAPSAVLCPLGKFYFRLVRAADDLAVADLDHALRVPRDAGVVRHQDDRDAFLAVEPLEHAQGFDAGLG